MFSRLYKKIPEVPGRHFKLLSDKAKEGNVCMQIGRSKVLAIQNVKETSQYGHMVWIVLAE